MTFPIIDRTHDPRRTSWVESANGHADFPIQNLPLGIFSTLDGGARPGMAIGDMILDLRAAAEAELLPEPAASMCDEESLNALFALPMEARMALRQSASDMLSDPARRGEVEPCLIDALDATMHLPCEIGDYTDFYVGIHHATNVGKQFRPDNPLLPNYKYVPIGYHGRASSVRVSGVDVVRPKGQRKAPDADAPVYAPSRRLDYELEMGVWIGEGCDLGETIPIGEARRHVAGLCLLNDWSARDLQAWEYQPLGPFLAKNFQTSVSPWVVTAEALAPFHAAQPPRPDGDPAPLPYLLDAQDQAEGAFAIQLETFIETAKMRAAGKAPYRLSVGPMTSMYWTIGQMVAHHASNGCNLQPGDLLGTGTISGPDDDSLGSLLEISRGGKQPVTLPNGETRSFLEDCDRLTLTARAQADGAVPIGFGACSATILPARQY